MANENNDGRFHFDEAAMMEQARANLLNTKQYSKLYDEWKRLDPKRDFVKITAVQMKLRKMESAEFDRLERLEIERRKEVKSIDELLRQYNMDDFNRWQELLAGMSFLFDMIDFSIADINELLDRNEIGVKMEKFKEIEAARKVCIEMAGNNLKKMAQKKSELWMDESDRLWERLKERCAVYRRKVDKWESSHPEGVENKQ